MLTQIVSEKTIPSLKNDRRAFVGTHQKAPVLAQSTYRQEPMS